MKSTLHITTGSKRKDIKEKCCKERYEALLDRLEKALGIAATITAELAVFYYFARERKEKDV